MSRQIIYWLEDSEGNQVGSSTTTRLIIERDQKDLAESGIETTIKMEYFR